MLSEDIVAAARARIEAGELEQVANQAYRLRNRARDMMARVVMNIRRDSLNEQGRIDWTKVAPPDRLGEPLSREEVAAFLASDPPDAALSPASGSRARRRSPSSCAGESRSRWTSKKADGRRKACRARTRRAPPRRRATPP